MSAKIYIGNLPYSASEEHVRETFSQYGEIVEVALIKDRVTGRAKGFGFVTFGNESGAQSALAMDGQDFHGRNIRVSIARENDNPRRQHGGGRSHHHDGGYGRHDS